MESHSIKTGICQIGKLMYDNKFVVATDGNISVRKDRIIFITPSGMSKGELTEPDIILTDLCGKKVSGTRKISSEFIMHQKIYETRPDIMAICHAHPINATAVSMTDSDLNEPLLQEVILTIGKICLIPYGTTGTSEIAENLVPFLSDCDAFLLANHGVLTLGRNLKEAYQKLETLEHYAEIFIKAKTLGNVRNISNINVQKLYEIRCRTKL
ncbi:MAG: class II aldolase/adducin family protein [Candidatus Cloacimonetes bacterium]|nr:class II aldolase/adducin family protein [Candidatus Cloacimonadota bacterium]